MAYTITLGKENFKFSCTHFTIFGPGQAERMHGHNYHVEFKLYFDSISDKEGLAVDFNIVKPIIKEICDLIDEHILIPEKSPHIGLEMDSDQVQLIFSEKSYSLPREDVLVLPLVNISSEELARYVCECFIEKAPGHIGLTKVDATIEETRGQSVTYSLLLN